jgi:AcrR family transcriptional regulator
MDDSKILAPSRSRNAERTKGAILRAAQQAFAARGYAHVSMREIGREAGVDHAMINRYFGTKEGLFKEALNETLLIDDLLDTPREEAGSHIAAMLCQEPSAQANPLPIMLMAMADPDIKSLALDLLNDRIMVPLAGWVGGANARELAARISMLCAGFVVYTRLLPLSIYSGGIDEGSRSWLALQLQSVIDQACQETYD